MRRIGMLTSGGDCQALNAAMRGVVKTLANADEEVEIYGFLDGYRGLIYSNFRMLTSADFSGILTKGGTILGSSRTPFKLIREPGENGIDKVEAMKQNYHKLKVSPCYFDVFRMKDKEGRAITPLVENAYRPLVITAEAEDFFFGGQSAIGRQISENDDLSEPFTIAAVLPTFRSNDFDRPENCAFTILKGESLREFVKNFGVRSAELSVRTKRPMTEDEMYAFLEKTADRMTVNNTFVHGVTLLADQRDDQLRFTKNENSKKLSMMAFLLVNVFFGIVGTFWLRTERRRSEIGLRMAIGSSRGRLGEYMYLEGLGLLAITVPILLVFVFNMAFLDKLDSYREPLSILRFLVTLSVSYLLMAGMICMGIWFPVRKAVKMAPAEALHYE